MSMYGQRKVKGFVTAYGPKVVIGVDAGPTDDSPGAIQSFKDECDINNIMAGVQRTGATSWLETRPGTYEDVTGVDFQTAMDQILRAQEAFDDLPSAVRDRFQNNPVAFLDFVHDPRNAAEMVTLGLRNPPAPAPVPAAAPGAA